MPVLLECLYCEMSWPIVVGEHGGTESFPRDLSPTPQSLSLVFPPLICLLPPLNSELESRG